MAQLILFNKPYGVISQFSGSDDEQTLAQFIARPGYYPAGRLDKKSEGLLLLTNDGRLQHRICAPESEKYKHYWVQVEGSPTKSQIDALRQGPTLNDFQCKPAKVAIIPPPNVWERKRPIRVRKTVPDTWLSIAIQEGKNHQIRRMTASVGLPTLRLIRYKIDTYTLGILQPGEWRLIKA